MRRFALLALLLAGCATASTDAPRATYDPHNVGPTSPTNPNNNDPRVWTHIEPRPSDQPTSTGAACGSGCAADEVCDTSGAVHRCVKKSTQPAWVPGAQPASKP